MKPMIRPIPPIEMQYRDLLHSMELFDILVTPWAVFIMGEFMVHTMNNAGVGVFSQSADSAARMMYEDRVGKPYPVGGVHNHVF